MEIKIYQNNKTVKHCAEEFVRIIGIVCFDDVKLLSLKINEELDEDEFKIDCEDFKCRFEGGSGRALLYAVYDYFAVGYGVKYFWDGDVFGEKRAFVKVIKSDSPRFKYRGLRYFAHRGLYRFQAEEWTFSDWKKELDWIVKNKMNTFMLRLGNRNAFERAFPEDVAYDNTDGCKYDGQKGFFDRTPIRSSYDDIKLERQINDYADMLGLIRPVDCGTMTHWYSQTPISFIEKENPKFLSQSTDIYNENRSLVWDIRNERELEMYFKLTDAYVKEFGQQGLFHTIGLAERLFSANRKENLELKKYTYRKILEKIVKEYPSAKLLIASWDFSMFWNNEEVKELLGELDSEKCIILDYTSDTQYKESNFTNWGVCGRFPYIFGIFHAYEPQNDIRGDLELIEERLKIADADEYCKGFVFWPELSHGDGFMTDFIARNSWKVDARGYREQIEEYCLNRFGKNGKAFCEIYAKLYPISSLGHWCGDRVNPQRAIFRDFTHGELTSDYEMPLFAENITKERIEELKRSLDKYKIIKDNAKAVIGSVSDIYDELDTEGARCEAFDMARTATSRDIHYKMIEAGLEAYEGRFDRAGTLWERIEKCVEAYTELIGTNEEYSIASGIKKMGEEWHINPYFISDTIKENTDNIYCRNCAYELMKGITVDEIKAIGRWIKRCGEKNELKHDTELKEDIKALHDAYRERDIFSYGRLGMSVKEAMSTLIEIL